MAQMSNEQDVRAPGWFDPGAAGRAGATAAVVPGQRTEADPEVSPDAAPRSPDVTPQPQEQPAAAEPPRQEAPRQEAAGPTSTPYPTTPVGIGVRPRARVRVRRRDPLTRMGPWAPVAGAVLGLALGVVVGLFLSPEVDTFD